MSDNKTVTGFYGKLPALGDFVNRRLSRVFIDTIDEWMQSGLSQTKEVLGDQWLTSYLTSPVWRYALSPGVCDQQSWIGVMIPSVDKVGRYFPLTIAAPLGKLASPMQSMHVYANWYQAAEELALYCLQDDFDFEQFDQKTELLEAVKTGNSDVLESDSSKDTALAWHYELNEPQQLPILYPFIIEQLLGELFSSHSVWWTNGSQTIKPCLLVSQSLPTQSNFPGLMCGHWERYAWSQRGKLIVSQPDKEPSDQ